MKERNLPLAGSDMRLEEPFIPFRANGFVGRTAL